MKATVYIVIGGLFLTVIVPLLMSIPTTIACIYQLSYLITWMFS